jgi:hypothetical protein
VTTMSRLRRAARAPFIAVVLALSLAGEAARAQEATRKPETWIGAVTAIDVAQRRLTAKSDAGASVWIAVEEKARLLRAKPGARDLSDATPVAFEALSVGDRILVRGTFAEDRSSMVARQIVVMTQEDISSRHEAERADWARRGILGVVTAVDPASGEVTLQMRRFGGAATIVLPTANRAIVFRRYAPDSVKFSDALPSRLSEVQVGDQLRALGERSADGSRFMAEQIVFGTFRTVAGEVETADAAKGLLTIHDEETGKSLAVTVGPDARIRRLPPEFAARFAQRAGNPPGGGGAEGAHPGYGRPEGRRTPGEGTGQESERARAWRPGGGGQDILDRLPVATLADLKPGERVLVSSTKGADPSKLTAIALVTGLDALRPAASAARMGRGTDVGIPADLMDLGMGSGAP